MSVCGLGYKIGSVGKVYPIQSASMLSLFGFVVFGILGLWKQQSMPWSVFCVAAVMGFTQYAGIRLMRKALQTGPFSPVWCAVSLAFVPVIVYSAIALKETLSLWKILSILATAGAIVSASFSANDPGGPKADGIRKKMLYGMMLVLLLGLISLCSVGLKFCDNWFLNGSEESVLSQSGDLVLSVLYFFMGVPCALDLSLSRTWRWNRQAWIGGCLLTGGALVQFALLKHFIALPAMILFAMSYSTSILLTTLVSTIFYHEKRTLSWYLTLGCSVLAILLNSVPVQK